MRKRITQKTFLAISLCMWNLVSSQSNHLYYHKNPSPVKEGSPIEISQLLFGEEGINSGMLFFRDNGLLIYNRIVYLESEFTRRAQAKKTLHHRKIPKCEQKIYAFYKGDPSKIKELYPNIGRL